MVHVPDSREDVHKLQIFDADEVMQTRQIGDEVLSRFEAEDFERMKSSAMFSSLSIPAVDANSTCLPLKGRLRRPDQSFACCHDDDDAIVIDFQQLLGFRPAVDSIRGFVSDRKSLEIKSLEMVDQTGVEPVTS